MEKQEEKMEDMVCCPEDQKVVEDGNSDHVSLRGAGESEKVSQPQLIVVFAPLFPPFLPQIQGPDPVTLGVSRSRSWGDQVKATWCEHKGATYGIMAACYGAWVVW